MQKESAVSSGKVRKLYKKLEKTGGLDKKIVKPIYFPYNKKVNVKWTWKKE